MYVSQGDSILVKLWVRLWWKESWIFWSQGVLRQKSFWRSTFLRLLRWWTLMGLSMEIVDAILAGLISIDNGAFQANHSIPPSRHTKQWCIDWYQVDMISNVSLMSMDTANSKIELIKIEQFHVWPTSPQLRSEISRTTLHYVQTELWFCVCLLLVRTKHIQKENCQSQCAPVDEIQPLCIHDRDIWVRAW